MEVPPRENQKLMTMKKLLIKHLKQEQAIQSKLDESLNIFADKIAKSYKSKLAFDFLQKEISDELCSISGKKDEYRKNLNRLLRDNGQPNILQNIYYYFFKFGLKNLGFDEKSVEKELIKEINNCLFLNVSFKSTKFTGIKFKTVKFINASSGSKIYKKLMNRSDKLRTLKDKFNKYESFSFENVDLTVSGSPTVADTIQSGGILDLASSQTLLQESGANGVSMFPVQVDVRCDFT